MGRHKKHVCATRSVSHVLTNTVSRSPTTFVKPTVIKEPQPTLCHGNRDGPSPRSSALGLCPWKRAASRKAAGHFDNAPDMGKGAAVRAARHHGTWRQRTLRELFNPTPFQPDARGIGAAMIANRTLQTSSPAQRASATHWLRLASRFSSLLADRARPISHA